MAAGVASAQAAPSAQTGELVGVNARLDHALDTNSVKQGQAIEAKLDGSVTTAGGVKLAKGTQLMGTVTSVQTSANGGPSSLTFAFTTAQTKDGKQIPVKVTLLSVYPADANDLAIYGVANIAAPPQHVSAEEKIDQESGPISHVSLHSSVQADNSGTLTKRDGNLKLAAGTWLQVGIAPGSNANSSGE